MQRLILKTYSNILVEDLTGSQLVKKFPTFYGTRRFIAALTRVCHMSLSKVTSIQLMPHHLTY
jgi:hypothetical protein